MKINVVRRGRARGRPGIIISPENTQPEDQRAPFVVWESGSLKAQLYSNCRSDLSTNLLGVEAIEFAGNALLEVARRIREKQLAVDAAIASEQP